MSLLLTCKAFADLSSRPLICQNILDHCGFPYRLPAIPVRDEHGVVTSRIAPLSSDTVEQITQRAHVATGIEPGNIMLTTGPLAAEVLDPMSPKGGLKVINLPKDGMLTLVTVSAAERQESWANMKRGVGRRNSGGRAWYEIDDDQDMIDLPPLS